MGELVAALHTSVHHQRLSAAVAELQQRCTELLAAGLLSVQQRKEADDRAILAEAGWAAFAGFKAAAESLVPTGCTDVDDARVALEVRHFAVYQSCMFSCGLVSQHLLCIMESPMQHTAAC